MEAAVLRHYARIGRLGGRASTPAKRAAARRNALKRWGRRPGPSTLPMEMLCDRAMYRGEGRNSRVGLWDARAHCFWTIAVNDFADPARFPSQGRRYVRLKREEYFTPKRGTFKPEAVIG